MHALKSRFVLLTLQLTGKRCAVCHITSGLDVLCHYRHTLYATCTAARMPVRSYATWECATLDDLARCLLAVAGSATSLSKSILQSVCGQGRSGQNKLLFRCMVATCPLYQCIRFELAVCRCAGTWVHCSSLALPPKIFTLMQIVIKWSAPLVQFHAIYVSSMPAHFGLCSPNNRKPIWPT